MLIQHAIHKRGPKKKDSKNPWIVGEVCRGSNRSCETNETNESATKTWVGDGG